VRARYGPQLKLNRLFVRTRQPRAKDTLIRLEASYNTGAPCFRAAAVVVLVIEPPASGQPPAQGAPEPGMGLSLLAIDEPGRQIIETLGGKPPAALRETGSRPPPPAIPREWKPPVADPNAPPPAERTGVHYLPDIIPKSIPESERPTPPSVQPVPAAVKPAPVEEKPAPVAAGKPPESAPPPQPQPSTPPGLRVDKRGLVIGIDLGTTNSAAGVLVRGKPTVIQSREGYNTIPSIVALRDGKLLVGHPAKRQMITNPMNTVYGAKRLVGRPFTSPVVQEMRGKFPYTIEPGPRGEAAVKLGDEQLTLQKIQSLILAEVREMAQQTLGTEIQRCVITVPAYYNDNQRQAVREAGKLAGLEVLRILSEPTAAALAFAHGRFLEQRVLVYDLGGGTFDASVLELHGNVYEVVTTGGDTFLGGIDFDRALAEHLIAGFQEQFKAPFPVADRAAYMRVLDAAERAKIALSEQLEVRVHVPFVAELEGKQVDLDTTLSRTEVVLLTGHLIDRTLRVCMDVLATKGLRTSDVNEVLLVGGQSRMPLVRERIRQLFGREPNKVVHPDEAVALGAALLADSMTSGQITGAPRRGGRARSGAARRLDDERTDHRRGAGRRALDEHRRGATRRPVQARPGAQHAAAAPAQLSNLDHARRSGPPRGGRLPGRERPRAR
jgi:molecular chaperone DnaK